MSFACLIASASDEKRAMPGHRAERLLARHRRIGRDAGDHGRPVEEPAHVLAAREQLAAALERVGDVPLDLLDRLLLDQRADLRLRLEAASRPGARRLLRRAGRTNSS